LPNNFLPATLRRMKPFVALACAAFIFSVLAARAAGPDDQFVELYGLIQEADRLADSGETRFAIAKYVEAQTGLKNLQTNHPDWNAKIVSFRLGYVASRLEPLTKKVATGAAGPAPVVLTPGQILTNQIRQLQEEVDRLANQNALLEGKVREALTVQPAASDPRELAKAEEKAKQLQKERDLLSVSLEQARAAAAAAAGAGDKQAIEEMKKQFAAQSAAAESLRKQNAELQKQIADASAAPKPAAVPSSSPAELAQLRETIAMLQASNRTMQAEQVAMESRLLDWVRRHSANTNAGVREKEMEAQLAAATAAATAAKKERDELLAKLNDVTRHLNERPAAAPAAASTEALEKQLEALRAKVQIFEAKAVPYTPEELALFKQPPTREILTDTNKPVIAAATPATPKKRDELPPGSAGLMAGVERAIDAGRFDEAERKLTEILRMDEGNVFLLSRISGAQMAQDKLAEAEATLKKALALDSEHPVCLSILGDIRYRQQKYDEAIDAFSLSVKVRPDHAATHFMLGRALIEKGNRAPAESALRKAVHLRPTWGEPHYQLAVLYATQKPGYPELAQYHYKKAIAGGIPQNFELEKTLQTSSTKKP